MCLKSQWVLRTLRHNGTVLYTIKIISCPNPYSVSCYLYFQRRANCEVGKIKKEGAMAYSETLLTSFRSLPTTLLPATFVENNLKWQPFLHPFRTKNVLFQYRHVIYICDRSTVSPVREVNILLFFLLKARSRKNYTCRKKSVSIRRLLKVKTIWSEHPFYVHSLFLTFLFSSVNREE